MATVAVLESNWQTEDVATRPIPPPAFIRRVNSAEKAEPGVFLRSGATDLLAIGETLSGAAEKSTCAAGDIFPERPAVMELGCGMGRRLRHVPVASLDPFHATDVNPDVLGWCGQISRESHTIIMVRCRRLPACRRRPSTLFMRTLFSLKSR
jgi:hypothetical protein